VRLVALVDRDDHARQALERARVPQLACIDRAAGDGAARELELTPGSVCALVGEASSGKSTVLTAIWTLLEAAAPPPTIDDVARALLEQDIAVEAGLWSADAVDAWLDSPLRDKHLRVLLELADGMNEDDVHEAADDMLDRLHGRTELPVLLHGAGTSAWPAYHYAVRMGLDTRIGLEDTLELPDGTTARDNAALVHAARVMAGSHV